MRKVGMPIRVAVVGAGRGVEAIIQLLGESPEVQIVAVADVDTEAPGLRLARERGIPTLSEHRAVFRHDPEVVIEATGRREVLEDLLRARPPGSEVIGARSARRLWNFIEARERSARRLETLLLLSQSLTSTLHLETVLDLIVEAASKLLPAEAVGLWVMQEGSGELTLRASTGATELLARSSAALGQAEDLVREMARGQGWCLHAELGPSVETVLTVPLLKDGRLLGTLGMIGRGVSLLTEADHDLLDSFASQAAIALENSRLYGELRAALEKVEVAQQQLVQAERLRALGEMAGGVAHDFNNILAAILGRAQLLLIIRAGDPEVQRQLQVIEKVAVDGARTVRRIQEFTRMRRARPFQPVDLNRVIEEVVEITRSRWKDEAQATGVPYDVRVEAAPLPPVAGDPSELREALTNIVFNALDAMPEGGRVTFRTGVEGERVYCVVTDTGVGMTEEVRQRIFDPFFTTKGEKGNGLGLSVVYGIIVRHGAEIEVQSQVGQGSAFTIRLPVAREIPEAPEMGPPPPPHRRAKILIIDDEGEVREVLAELLASQGHTVATCADGESGLTRLQQELFDLVVTDLAMPGLTGWQVASAVKSRNPETPVALVTGWGDRIDPDEARVKGVDFLLAKPVKLEDIAALVARALTRGKLGKG